jgi:phenylacetate-CoA ligase
MWYGNDTVWRTLLDIRYRSSIPMAEQSKRGPGAPVPFARFRRHKLVMNISTGSTGTPTTFYEDGSTTALNWAHELRLKEWYGLEPGVREARLARVSTEYLPKSRILWLRKHLWHHLILPGMNLSDADYAMCLRKIKEFRPEILFGITSALTGLADHIQRTREDVSSYRPSLVISWAAPLYEHEKSLLEEIFGAPVTNIYGTREVGHVAALCPHGSLHINQEQFIVESEGDANDDSSTGPGETLVTTLNGSPMPFIRYRIGDLGEVARGDCPCGRTLQVLKNLLGRSGEVFITKVGRMIAPNFWCRLFMVGEPSQSVERFQVIIRKNERIRFRIVREDNYSAETEADLRRSLDKNFQEDIQFEFEYVSAIEPQPSGKYQLVINEMTS